MKSFLRWPSCRYTQEELQGLQDGAAVENVQAAPAASKPDVAAVKKKIMALIPKDKEGIFRFNVKWSQLDCAPQDVKDRISSETATSFVCLHYAVP
jgi:hypothetical protein